MQRVYRTPKQSPTCETKLGNFQEIRKNIRKQGKISTYISIFLFYENVYNTRVLRLINTLYTFKKIEGKIDFTNSVVAFIR